MPLDINIGNHGSLFLLTPLTPTGREWVDEHLPEDALWFGNGVAVEPRYVEAILQGMADDGLALPWSPPT